MTCHAAARLLPESAHVLSTDITGRSEGGHTDLGGELGLHSRPEGHIGTAGHVGGQLLVSVVDERRTHHARHSEAGLASLRVEEVDSHLVRDHALRALLLGLEVADGGVTESSEGHSSLVRTLLPSGGLSGGGGFVVGHLSSHLVLQVGDLPTGHTEAGHTGLVGESVGSHLEMDESLRVAVLVVGLADFDNSGHSNASHAGLRREFVGSRLEGHDSVGGTGLLLRHLLRSSGSLGAVVHVTGSSEACTSLLGGELVG
ncbi:hypothetical protein PFISCL1PPCAC_1488, partial [Pristionchus fissidentatus]